jgi:prephenate dehydrogenase
LLTDEKALMDFCSLKKEVVETMMKYTSAEVVGTHPMFGPYTDSLNGQNIILCPGRGEKWLNWIRGEFQATGAVVSVIDSEKHDKTMAVAQGLTHLLTITTGRVLQKMDMSPMETEKYSTPIFKLKNDLIGRLFAQDPELYATLVGSNTYVHEVVDIFDEAFKEAKDILLSNDHDAKVSYLKDIRGFIGEYCQKGLEESNKILKSVV